MSFRKGLKVGEDELSQCYCLLLVYSLTVLWRSPVSSAEHLQHQHQLSHSALHIQGHFLVLSNIRPQATPTLEHLPDCHLTLITLPSVTTVILIPIPTHLCDVTPSELTAF